jgi:ribokinase
VVEGAVGRVVVAGSLNWDLQLHVDRFARPGETVIARRSRDGAGGKGLNQAVAAARAGATVVFAGTVGDDEHGAHLLGLLRHEGIDASLVRVVGGESTGLAVVQIDAEGANHIVVRRGANAVTAGDVVDGFVMSAVDVLVAQAEISEGAVVAFVAAGRAAGARTLLNLAPFRPVPTELLADVSILIVNQHEAAGLLGAPPLDVPPVQVAARVRALGPDVAVVTYGEAGLAVATDSGEWFEPARIVTARDTTGAGDALVGVTAAALAGGVGLGDALRRGMAAAALVVQRDGAAEAMPHRADLEQELARPQG